MQDPLEVIYSEPWQQLVDTITTWFSTHGLKIAILLSIGWFLYRYGARTLSRIIHRTIRRDLYPTKADRDKRVRTLDSLINGAVKLTVFIVIGLMVMGELGVNTAPLLASAGILGIALGFGAQSLIRDFTSGIFIIADNQYRVGDIVRLNDIEGKVEAITIRTTVLRDLGGNVFHVPNGSIIVTANMTMGYGGINENLIIDDSADIERVEHIINHVGEQMASDPHLKNKIKIAPYFKRVVGFTEEGIEIKVLGQATANDQWVVQDEMYKRLLIAFRHNKMKIPTSKKPSLRKK